MERLQTASTLIILTGLLFISRIHCQTDVRENITLSVTLPQSLHNGSSSTSDKGLEVTVPASSSPTPSDQNTVTSDAIITSKLTSQAAQETLTFLSIAASQSSVQPSVSPVVTSSKDLNVTKSHPTAGPPYDAPNRYLSKADLAAIISGCLMILLTFVLYLIDGLILKYVKVTEVSHPGAKRGAGDAAFYEGLHPHSAQTLVGAMSSQSFGSSPSVDQHLNTFGHAVYYNRGYEIDQHTAGGQNNAVVQLDASAPTRGSKRMRTSFNQSNA